MGIGIYIGGRHLNTLDRSPPKIHRSLINIHEAADNETRV